MEDLFGIEKPYSEMSLREISPITLAFIGDSVHTMFVRTSLLKMGNLSKSNEHKIASKFCNAKAQSIILDEITPSLTEVELEYVKRARNAKTNNKAKSATAGEYKKATAFEALIGYLYLTKQNERMLEILQKSIIGEKN